MCDRVVIPYPNLYVQRYTSNYNLVIYSYVEHIDWYHEPMFTARVDIGSCPFLIHELRAVHILSWFTSWYRCMSFLDSRVDIGWCPFLIHELISVDVLSWFTSWYRCMSFLDSRVDIGACPFLIHELISVHDLSWFNSLYYRLYILFILIFKLIAIKSCFLLFLFFELIALHALMIFE